MIRTSWTVALCLAAAAVARAQEAKDGTFTSADPKVKFSVPDKDKYVLRTKDFEFGWPNALCELANDEAQIGGVLVACKTGKTAKEYAEWRMTSWKTQEGLADFKEIKSEKLAGKTGDWWTVEYSFKYGDTVFHYLEFLQAVPKEQTNVELALWCVEEGWAAAEPAIRKTLDTLQVGEEKKTDPKTDPKSDGAKIDHPWLKYGEGSWVELQISTKMTKPVASESEMTTKRTLLKKGDKLKFKLETKMTKPAAMEMPAQETEEDAKIAGGSGTGGTGGAKELGKGDEELDVAGKKVKCKWVETEYEMNGKKTTTKSWTSDEVPGGVVKSVTKNEDMESTMVVTGFEKK